MGRNVLINKQDLKFIIMGVIVLCNVYGFVRAFSVLVPLFKDYLQVEDKAVSLFPGLLMIGIALSSLLNGTIIPKYGSSLPCKLAGCSITVGFFLFTLVLHYLKSLYLLYFIMFIIISFSSGIFISCGFTCTAKLATPEVLGLVLTMQASGATLGTLVLQPFYLMVLKYIDQDLVKMMYIISGLQILNIYAAYLLPNDLPKPKALEVQENKEFLEAQPSKPTKPKLFSFKLLFSRTYLNFIVGCCLYVIGNFCITTVCLKPFYASFQFTTNQISQLFLVSGIIELLARFIYAFVLVESFDKIYLLAGTFAFNGLSYCLICLPVVDQFYSYRTSIVWVGTIFYSFFAAGWSGLMSSVLYKINKVENFAVATGMYLCITGVSNGFGPLVAGSIVDFLREDGNGTSTLDLNSSYNLYEDPYWAAILASGLGLMVPAGLVILALKTWF